MKIQWKKLIICIIIPLAVGGASAFLTKDGIQVFEWINKPPLSPPAWLFPVAWTILYVLMGIASYLVLVNENNRGPALTVYGIQLFFNFVWPIIFFNMEAYLLAFIWLSAMWILIIVTTVQKNIESGRFASDSLYTVGRLCGISQFWHISFELISVSTEHLAYKITFPGDLHRNDRRNSVKVCSSY